MKNDPVKGLAEKIARMIESESQNSDVSSVVAALERIEKRLDRLEQSNAARVQIPTPVAAHPSLDKLNIAEAIADSIFGSQFKEKACTFEPSKPCDHCSMCNSRGF